jgi:hypothetical protein
MDGFDFISSSSEEGGEIKSANLRLVLHPQSFFYKHLSLVFICP